MDVAVTNPEKIGQSLFFFLFFFSSYNLLHFVD